ncbi:unnamed protein product (macronuclear) [Paramecium tetraurelia]|uniref:RING-type domain-containing protein n=1 Tax=Paramecium tetraurelia TaxID=5888 RepID=A0BXQ0_PARTE|nr:uncharacterized protein GSPATT00033170001 [Paramecium tetraurelia]CAK63317.1 unnamed protein product [Paramecium tetraurelia]|eukprot:XP_001430715.1 hypothetical protein (macronuclear) [Paramecium tetraurelia strain d4-2]
MYLLILFVICNAFHHKGSLQTNTTLNLALNFTDQAPSIIIKFFLPIARQNQQIVGCFVSFENLTLYTFELDQLQLKVNSNIDYDVHSIQSNSDTQLVQYPYYSMIYLLCQSDQNIIIDYELTYLEDYLNPFCINNCKGYNDTRNGNSSYCLNNYCECSLDKLGEFCQLDSSYLINSNWVRVNLDSYQWKYFYYQIRNTNIELQSNLDQSDQNISKNSFINKVYSLTLRQHPWISIPNRKFSYFLTNCSSLSDTLQDLISEETTETILYIGLYNNNSIQVKFNLSVVTTSSDDDDEVQRNKLILIIVGSVVGVLLLLSFFLSIFNNQRMNQNAQHEENIEQNLEIQQIAFKSPSGIRQFYQGFTKQFIKDYFDPINVQEVMKSYPGLSQFEDCVICLETLKNGISLEMKLCSVTPCFHIFHFQCLSSWLQKQRNCPFCRNEFNRIQIQNIYPWVELNKEKRKSESEQESQYLQRLKHNQNTDLSQDIQLNDSQQDFVHGKNRPTVEG